MTPVPDLHIADAFAQALGMVLESEHPVTVALDLEERHMNFHGVTHGGVLFSLADAAFALASNRAGERAVAIDAHLVLTAGTKVGDRLTAVAEEVTRGRTLGTYRVGITRSDGRVCGLFTGTVFIG